MKWNSLDLLDAKPVEDVKDNEVAYKKVKELIDFQKQIQLRKELRSNRNLHNQKQILILKDTCSVRNGLVD